METKTYKFGPQNRETRITASDIISGLADGRPINIYCFMNKHYYLSRGEDRYDLRVHFKFRYDKKLDAVFIKAYTKKENAPFDCPDMYPYAWIEEVDIDKLCDVMYNTFPGDYLCPYWETVDNVIYNAGKNFVALYAGIKGYDVYDYVKDTWVRPSTWKDTPLFRQ